MLELYSPDGHATGKLLEETRYIIRLELPLHPTGIPYTSQRVQFVGLEFQSQILVDIGLHSRII